MGVVVAFEKAQKISYEYFQPTVTTLELEFKGVTFDFPSLFELYKKSMFVKLLRVLSSIRESQHYVK